MQLLSLQLVVVSSHGSEADNLINLHPSKRIGELKIKTNKTQTKQFSRFEQTKRLNIQNEEWRFPYFAKTRFLQTQGYNGQFSHQNKFALDFSNGNGVIVPTKSGTISTLNFGGKWDQWCNSYTDCFNKGGVWNGNHILITHLDGSVSFYIHLRAGSLFPGITSGMFVEQGTPLAIEGGTGYTCGDLNVPCSTPYIHLHFQVSRNGATFATPFADCGFLGNDCPGGVTRDGLYYTSTNIAPGLVANSQDKNISLFGRGGNKSIKIEAPTRGSGIRLSTDLGNQLSKWNLLSNGEIRGINDWCLTGNGNALTVQDCNNQNEQKWIQQPDKTIKNTQSGLCLESEQDDTNNSRISLNSCNQSRSQQWRFGNQGYPVKTFDESII